MILLTANQKSAQLAFQTWCNCHLSSESLDKEVWSILISCSVVGRARRFRNFRLLARVWRRQSLYLHGRSSRSYLLLDGLHGVLQFVRDMHHERGRRHQPWCHSFLDGVMWNEPRWSWWNLQGSPAVFTIVLVKLAGSPAVFMSRVRRAFASDVPVADGRKPRIALALETFRVKRPRQRWGIEPVHVFPGGPGTVLVKKTTIFFKNVVFATAKRTFAWAKFGQILAREFGQIRVSWGFWTLLIGPIWQKLFMFFKAGASALKSWNGLLLDLSM